MGQISVEKPTPPGSDLGGNQQTIVPFAPQFRGQPIRDTLTEYRKRAARAMIDYGLHQIITDPSERVVKEEIPRVVAEGIRNLKVFLTYDAFRLDDAQYLRVLAAARQCGALVCVHCENDAAIGWRIEALAAAGMTAPRFHAAARPAVVEREATYRAIALAELVDEPIQVFPVSCPEVAEEIARAQARGVKVWGETCPQYLTLGAEDMDREGFDGAKYVCSPSPRDAAARAGMWEVLRPGTLSVIPSDHCGYSFAGERGKAVHGRNAPFAEIPNGIPGLAARMALVFSEGVSAGKIALPEFVRLTAAHPTRLFGLFPRKGSVAPGADADVVLWDAKKKVRLTNAVMQHAIDYTPYEEREVTGWPVMTIARGRVAMEEGRITAEPGEGNFLARGPYEMIRLRGVVPDGFDAAAVGPL